MFFRILFAAFFGTICAACTSVGDVHSFTKTTMKPSATAMSTPTSPEEILEASKGEFVLRVPFVPAGLISLESSMREEFGPEKQRQILEIPQNDFLFEVGIPKYGSMFCTLKPVVRRKDGRERAGGRICLRDSDGNGELDKMQDVNNQGLVSPFALQMVLTDRDLISPVAYSKVEPEDAPSMDVGIVLESRELSIAYELEDGTVKSAYAPNVSLKRDYPSEVTMLGAKLKLLGFEDQQLTYHILSGFPGESTIQIVCYRMDCMPDVEEE